MAVQLDRVVPFGRSLNEYVQMFDLTDSDLQRSILSVADGPASFNAEGIRLGCSIKSVDPLYVFNAAQIRARFDDVVDDIITQIEQSPEDWVWTYHASPSGLRKNREAVIDRFCEDYELGTAQGRYEVGAFPKLDYPDQKFDLGLCSHFLFLYSDHFDAEFHRASVRELLRVCQEVRIFPLMTLTLTPSPYLPDILERLEKDGFKCEVQPVAYELQRGGNKMLKITREPNS